MTPGDLTLSQIEAAFVAMRTVRQMALEGCSEDEIAQELCWTRDHVRAAAKVQGFTLCDLVNKRRVCPACGGVLEVDGHCELCVLDRRIRRLYEDNEEAHRQEVERRENLIDAIKSDTYRTRTKFGGNPRHKE